MNRTLEVAAAEELQAVRDIDDQRVFAVSDPFPLPVLVIPDLERRHRLTRDERQERGVGMPAQPRIRRLFLVLFRHRVVEHRSSEAARTVVRDIGRDFAEAPEGALGDFEDDVEQGRELPDHVVVEVRDVVDHLGKVLPDQRRVSLTVADRRMKEVALQNRELAVSRLLRGPAADFRLRRRTLRHFRKKRKRDSPSCNAQSDPARRAACPSIREP